MSFTAKDVEEYGQRLIAEQKTPHIYGIAISPATKAVLDATGFIPTETAFQFRPYPEPFMAIIVDPRLGDTSQAFYDETAWRARCIEQNAFDARATFSYD